MIVIDIDTINNDIYPAGIHFQGLFFSQEYQYTSHGHDKFS